MEIVSTNNCLISASFLFTFIVFVFYLYLKYVVYNFWARRGVPYVPPSIPLGNVPISYFKGETIQGTIVEESYKKFRKSRYYGLYMLWEPALVINDPELIRLVLVKNFNHFYNRGRIIDEHKDPLSASLDRMSDAKWKRVRGKLSPAFASGKLKLMYPLIEEICHELVNALDKTVVGCDEIEFKEFTTRYTVDCISSIAYGFNANSLHNPESIFFKYGRSSNYIGRLLILCSFFVPQLFRFIPVPATRKRNQKFFIDFFLNIVEQRRKEKIPRNDFLNMLIRLLDYGTIEDETNKLSDKVTEADKLTMMEAVGQSFLFFANGLEATSTLTTCCLFELARNPDIQQKLYDEIYKVHSSPDGLTYEKIFEMQYLDLVLQEALRKYPPTAFLSRICTEDFDVPDSKLTIEKGTRVFIPLIGLHMDPDIYPEPENFDPTRFMPENISKRHNFTYLPFGDGPRQCIAKRLGTLKVKMAIFHLLLNYKFSPSEKTPKFITFLPDYFGQVANDVPLKIEKRRQENGMTI